MKYQNSVVLKGDGEKLTVNGRPVEPPLTIRANGPIHHNRYPYRGDIKISAQDKGGPYYIINELPLEDYLQGVVGNEIPSDWPEAAVEAQTILARTYAVRKLRQNESGPYHVESTVQDQVYKGVSAEDANIRKAVNATRGMILTYQGFPIRGHYHSCCGGQTELPAHVWEGEPEPYQKSVTCGYCTDAPRYFWRYPEEGGINGKELAEILKLEGSVKEIQILESSPSGRVVELKAITDKTEKSFRVNKFRSLVGYEKVRGAMFEVKQSDKGFVFVGSGSGHGVGLCQWGARGMAERGSSAMEILNHYYPETKIGYVRGQKQ